jgi:hypothetical protein
MKKQFYTKITDGLTSSNLKKLSPRRDIGKGGELKFLAIAHLYIDIRYQRSVSARGHGNIRYMVENFFWSQFQPIVVSKIGSAKYAIIDGQHRAHACALHPEINFIPALVLDIPMVEQARAFAAINGRVTKIKPLDIYWAGVQGEDKKWLTVKQVCDDAGVAIYKTSPTTTTRQDGFTSVVNVLAREVTKHGADVVKYALSEIMQAYDGYFDELLGGPITLLCRYIARHGEFKGCAIERLSEVSVHEILTNIPSVSGTAKYPQALAKLERHMKVEGDTS